MYPFSTEYHNTQSIKVNHEDCFASTKPGISVVVPINNEVESLPDLIDAIAITLNANQLSYKIICVDDGS
jgi:hypothetical protein